MGGILIADEQTCRGRMKTNSAMSYGLGVAAVRADP